MSVLGRLLLLIGILVVGVIIGVNIAETNIQQVQGTEGEPRAIQITPQEDGKVEISLLGQVVEADNPVEKVDQEKIKDMTEKVKEENNHLSYAGNSIGMGISEATRQLFHWVFGWFA